MYVLSIKFFQLDISSLLLVTFICAICVFITTKPAVQQNNNGGTLQPMNYLLSVKAKCDVCIRYQCVHFASFNTTSLLTMFLLLVTQMILSRMSLMCALHLDTGHL